MGVEVEAARRGQKPASRERPFGMHRPHHKGQTSMKSACLSLATQRLTVDQTTCTVGSGKMESIHFE